MPIQYLHSSEKRQQKTGVFWRKRIFFSEAYFPGREKYAYLIVFIDYLKKCDAGPERPEKCGEKLDR
jgi:hypothetical protein